MLTLKASTLWVIYFNRTFITREIFFVIRKFRFMIPFSFFNLVWSILFAPFGFRRVIRYCYTVW
ncbi:unnamed protein product [Schistosoma mattheei]|uniref:Uncharacterized protein n=1 Tax=Schistosoma mattheei TaxID=31246 RepID=A0A183NI01_9TREM|nr:unnamed protein product [Schistosoma mattheei]